MSLALMDESGDPGLKLDRGSSALFTIAIVRFLELRQAQACKETIQALRGEFGFKQGKEFHFTDLGHKRRIRFLEAVAAHELQYYACTIDKKRLTGPSWRKKEFMYQQAAVRALDPALDEMFEAKLVFDATSSETFNRELLRFLKKHAGRRDGVPVIADTQSGRSRSDDLLQLVDMVCGAILADDPAYRKVIKHREGSTRVFP